MPSASLKKEAPDFGGARGIDELIELVVDITAAGQQRQQEAAE